MESISEIKLDLIKLITRITDAQQLNTIYQTIKSSEDQQKSMESTDDKFLSGQVEIRSDISKDQVFEEQDKKSITFKEVQELMTDAPCEESLEELLATLD
jgi:hypothetical protein